MSEYMPQEYPKWVAGVIVQNHAEELAHLEAVTAPEPEKVAEPVEIDAPASETLAT